MRGRGSSLPRDRRCSGGKHAQTSKLNGGDDPIIRRPYNDDRAAGLVRKEAVVLEFWEFVVKQARYRIERRRRRRDFSHFCIKSNRIVLLPDSEEFADDFALPVAERNRDKCRSRFWRGGRFLG